MSQSRRLPYWLTCFALATLCLPLTAWGQVSALVVNPAEVKLEGNFARVQLVVTAADAAGTIQERSEDLTAGATYASSDANIVTVNSQGLVLALADGQAKIVVTAGSVTKEVPVTVSGVLPQPVVGFAEHIRPILNKAGCAMAACHASQHGQGGFKLSVFGSEPNVDFNAMTRDSVQRRTDFVQPESSLLLLKPTMGVPHGGGRRIEKGSVEYQTLLAWIRAHTPRPKDDDPQVTRLHVFPPRRLGSVAQKQQLRVEAEYSNGKRKDVTSLARFDSMDDGVLAVSRDGQVAVNGKGQAAVMVRFDGQAEISQFVIPYAEQVPLAGWQNNNFVDELAAAKFRELGIEPSPLCDDATFIRRAYLDALGTLPTPEDTLAFLQSAEPDKRAKLVDRILGFETGGPANNYNDLYAAYWSLKWSDLIRNSSRELGDQGMWSLHNWIKESFRTNKPYDKFVRELITGKGSIFNNGPANYFRVNPGNTEMAESTSMLFLGVRLECAKCHHHPFEKYSQDDYYGLAAFFARVSLKGSEEFGIFGGEQVVWTRDSGEVSHPRTGKIMKPRPLDAAEVDHPLDRRIPLADWLTSKDNGLFARAIVNRYMSYLLGRGLVEPVDDMRSTNPPSNPALMEALSKQFAESGFNLKQLMRSIMISRLYQLDSQPTPGNLGDRRFYSYYQVKRLKAEPLADAVDRVTGTQTKYKSLPLGTLAIELPDAEYPDYFLNTFAKPRRASVCECERSPDENLAQALHTLNGDILTGKIADPAGRVAKLLTAKTPHQEIVTQLYLSSLCRLPSASERQAADQFLCEYETPAECYQDLLWALVNSKQFLFVR